MALSIFPQVTTPSLPFNATSSVFNPVWLSNGGYSYPTTIPAGTYAIIQSTPSSQNASTPISNVAYTSSGVDIKSYNGLSANYFQTNSNSTINFSNPLSKIMASRPAQIHGTGTSQGYLNKFENLYYFSSPGITVPSRGFLVSSDLITWTFRSYGITNATFGNIAYAPGITNKYCAGGDSTSGAGAQYATSTDGINWVQRAGTGQVGTTNDIIFGAGLYVATAQNSTNIFTSPDGVTWTNRTHSLGVSVIGIAFENSLFFAQPNNPGNSNYATSTDGITWTTRTSPFGNNFSMNKPIWANGRYVTTGCETLNNTPSTATSTNGITWTLGSRLGADISANVASKCWGYVNGAYWVSATNTSGGGSTGVYYSLDGLTWKSSYILTNTPSSNGDYVPRTSGSGVQQKYVLIDGNKIIAFSANDGIITRGEGYLALYNVNPATIQA